MAAWLGLDQLRAHLGVEPGPTADSTARRVSEATAAFLRGWGYTPSADPA
jgi:hypothetical protein